MQHIVVGSWSDAKTFSVPETYAVIAFVSTTHHRTAPSIPRPPQFRGRIIIRADDALPDHVDYDGNPLPTEHVRWGNGREAPIPMSEQQAARIVAFVRKMDAQIDTLFVHCVFGHGRSAAAAIAIARAYRLSWKQWTRSPYAPNPWIERILAEAFAAGKQKGMTDARA